MKRIGFIGCGNMGGALAQAASHSKSAMSLEISLADAFMEKAQQLAETIGDCRAADNETIARSCHYIFLGVKPQMMRDMLKNIGNVLKERAERVVLVSMAAGLSMETIREMAGAAYPVIRLMPNMPVSVGKGMILFCSLDVTEEEKAFFLQMMQAAGKFDEIPESLIDAGSAVSGCGPAFAYQFIEALADGAVACGVPRAKAVEYAAQMLSGAAEMVLQTKKHPGELKDAVCSPAGSTIQGVRTLEAHAFRGGVVEAVIASCEKTKELGKK
uniref:pyrroline-5-carboxylate reductase n=1 Tax=Agathobacter sp. TaxID=2021311 RepID=UPI004057CAEA